MRKTNVPSAEPGPQGENSGGRPRSAGLRGREGVALLECVKPYKNWKPDHHSMTNAIEYGSFG